MTALLSISIAFLLVAIAGSLVLIVRSGETRVGWLTVAYLALAVRQAVALWLHWGQAFAWNATGIAELGTVAASALSLVVLVALWRTIGERDRAESLHWNGMEVVRSLGELATQPDLGYDEKLASVLEMGRARFGLEVGMVSRASGSRYEVLAVRGPETFPVATGAVFSLEQTYCGPALKTDRPIGFERAEDAPWVQQQRAAFGFQSYLGAAIRVGDRVYGTLSFGSTQPREVRFTATEKDLLNLMAKWIGGEIERREGITSQRPGGRWREVRVPRGVDLNAVLRRLDKKLRVLAEPSVDLEVRLASKLEAAHAPRVPLETIIRTLVGNAIDAMPDGGRLLLETRNLDVSRGEPGVFPAVAPDRYVTLSVSDTGTSVDAEALSRGFESGEFEQRSEPREDGRLPLASIYRILQRCGGDLSVDVEPGRGSTFTVFLPLYRAQASKSDAPPAGASLPAAPPDA